MVGVIAKETESQVEKMRTGEGLMTKYERLRWRRGEGAREGEKGRNGEMERGDRKDEHKSWIKQKKTSSLH